MAGFYQRQKSAAALWCLRLAVISIPFLLLTLFLHRNGAISASQMFWLLAVAVAMLIGSLLAGARAAIDLWQKGYEGGRNSVKGIVLATLLLVPFSYQLWKAVENPQINDVATDVLAPPMFLQVPEGGLSATLSPDGGYDPHFARIIVSAYAGLVGRRYDAPVERVYAAVEGILKRWRAEVVATRNLPSLPGGVGSQEEEQLAGSGTEDPATGDAAVLTVPETVIQFRVRSLVARLPHDFVIRLAERDEATQVDARSASNWGAHDFGSNAALITAFLERLDGELAGIAGE